MASSHILSETWHSPETLSLHPKKRREVFHYALQKAVDQIFAQNDGPKWFRESLLQESRRNSLRSEIKRLMARYEPQDTFALAPEYIDKMMKKYPSILVASITEKIHLRTAQEQWVETRIKAHFNPLPQSAIRSFLESATTEDLRRMKHDITFLASALKKGGLSPVPITLPVLCSRLWLDQSLLTPEFEQDLILFHDTGYINEASVFGIIDHYKSHLDITQKRKILTFFLPTISVAWLQKANLLSVAERDELLERAFFAHLRFMSIASPMTYLSDPHISNEEQAFRQNQFESFSKYMLDERYIRMWQVPTSVMTDGIIDRLLLSDSTIRTLVTNIFQEEFIHTEAIQEERIVREFDDLEKDIAEAIKTLPTDMDKMTHSREMALNFLKHNLTLHERWKIWVDLNQFGVQDKYIISHYQKDKRAHWGITGVSCNDGTWGVQLTEFNIWGIETKQYFISYAHLARDFLKEIRRKDVNTLEITDTPQFEAPDKHINFPDRKAFENEVNQIDSIEDMPMQPGLAFSLDFLKQTHFFRVTDIDDAAQTITLLDSSGVVWTVSWEQFIGWIDKQSTKSFHAWWTSMSHMDLNFTRWGNISTFDNFADTFGGYSDAKYKGLIFKDNILQYKGEQESESKPLWWFSHKNGKKHLEVIQCPGDQVKVIEYTIDSVYTKWNYGERDAASVSRTSKVVINQAPKSLEFLAEYLHNEKYTIPTHTNPIATTKKGKDIQDDTGKDTLPNNNRWERKASFFSGWITVGSLIQTVKMGKDMIEHKLESKKRRKAAETLYKIAKFTGQDSDFTRQVMSQFANNIGELIDKRISHLEELSGEPRRREIKKILLRKPPIAYDLMAAMVVTVKMSGHLYPDSLLDELQGRRYIWFEQLCVALGYDPNTEVKKAIAKEKAENTSAEHVHETILITRFLKTNSGNNPYIQALRWGSKYWGAISEGRNGQVEKWAKEVKERSKPQDRKQYIMSKFKSNEFEIVVGAFPELWAINADPEFLGPAFVWSMSNATRVAHPEVIQKMANANLYGKGLTFHALTFARDPESARLYQRTVTLLVHELVKQGRLPAQAWEKLDRLMSLMNADPYGHNPNLYIELGNFWDAYSDILHPILQGAKPDLFILADSLSGEPNKKNDIISYIDTLSIHINESIKAFNKDILAYDGYNYESNFIFQKTEDSRHVSLMRQLNNFKIETDHVRITKDQNKLWKDSILKYIESIRTESSFFHNESYRREQFEVTYLELMRFIRSSFTTMQKMEPEAWEQLVQTQSYLQDLDSLGFNLSHANVFE